MTASEWWCLGVIVLAVLAALSYAMRPESPTAGRVAPVLLALSVGALGGALWIAV